MFHVRPALKRLAISKFAHRARVGRRDALGERRQRARVSLDRLLDPVLELAGTLRKSSFTAETIAKLLWRVNVTVWQSELRGYKL